MKINPLPILLTAFILVTHFACHETKKIVKPVTSPGAPVNSASMQLRNRITGYAQKYIGASYKYAGTSPSTGFDCSGFTSYVLKEFKVKVSSASAEQSKQGAKVSLERVRPGDLVFFGDESHIQHVAMVVERKKGNIICVHSTTSRGVIVENVSTSAYWKPKILFARDVIGG